MAAERIPMGKLREVIRLRLACGLSGRAIAQSCRLSVSTVSGYLGRVAVAKLSWPLPPALDADAALERLLFPDEGHPVRTRPEPDWAFIHRELRRPHVTKQLLWQEYREQQPDGYQYSQFCARYAAWAKTLSVTMRQTHRAGEKAFGDFSGDGLPIVDPPSGERQIPRLKCLSSRTDACRTTADPPRGADGGDRPVTRPAEPLLTLDTVRPGRKRGLPCAPRLFSS